ncbi:MAG: nucleoside deaminase [Bacteroidetes bacterium]|nr:nucleoside deaminase [Bacteroidota bacterium]
MLNDRDHEYFMKEALKEARKALDKKEIPIGAIIVENNKIIARAHNQVETLNDATAHAEMIALTSAFAYRNSKYIPDCEIYITLEPCIMCSYATHLAHISKIIYGADDHKKGFLTINQNLLHPKTEVIKGIMKIECQKLLKDFFDNLRN